MTIGPEDDAGLAGKVAIVSGGGARGDGIGNGRAAAILLARAGTRVVVADLDVKLAERTAEMIKAEAQKMQQAKTQVVEAPGQSRAPHATLPSAYALTLAGASLLRSPWM